ncbi:hypothetical protein A0H81_08875 [Grifola frondosa]|uniref:Uncharacterized protein n=1 Tax=Grifola frondosa TaxID=5627 RepID=A0A1C7M433_GRIFR|nr:hypothetical protein A0H81_08875 [Grifola frondosa]
MLIDHPTLRTKPTLHVVALTDEFEPSVLTSISCLLKIFKFFWTFKLEFVSNLGDRTTKVAIYLSEFPHAVDRQDTAFVLVISKY